MSANFSTVKLADFGSAFFETDHDNDPTPYLVSVSLGSNFFAWHLIVTCLTNMNRNNLDNLAFLPSTRSNPRIRI